MADDNETKPWLKHPLVKCNYETVPLTQVYVRGTKMMGSMVNVKQSDGKIVSCDVVFPDGILARDVPRKDLMIRGTICLHIDRLNEKKKK